MVRVSVRSRAAPRAQEELNQMVAEIDADNSGEIDFESFCTCLQVNARSATCCFRQRVIFSIEI